MPRQSTRGSGRGGAGSGGGSDAPPGGDEPVSGSIEPIEIQEEMERSFLEYSMSVIVARALPDVRDGLKPVHRRILYSMFDNGPASRPAPQQVRQGRRRGHGDLPPARRLGHLRGAGPHGAGVLAPPPPDRRPRQLRRPRPRRRRGGHALHRVPAGPARPRAHGGHRRRDRRHGRQLRRLGAGAGRAAGALPEPPRQRVPGHRGGHGDERPAAQHGRGDRRRHPRAAPPRGHARRAHGVRQGPRLPHRRAQILGRQGILDAYRTGRGSIKMRAVAEIEEGRNGDTHRRHRAPVPDVGRGRSSRRSPSSCAPATSTGSAGCATPRRTRSRASSSSSSATPTPTWS